MGHTLQQLITLYQTDPDSSFSKLRYQVRLRHQRLLARIDREHGSHEVQNIRTRTVIAWHRQWESDGKVAMARALFDRLRVLFKFGATILEDQDCDRLCDALEKIRLQKPTSRSEQMTSEHARVICTTAREHFGWNSIALAQAFQFDCALPQKDVIGEMVPKSEPVKSCRPTDRDHRHDDANVLTSRCRGLPGPGRPCQESERPPGSDTGRWRSSTPPASKRHGDAFQRRSTMHTDEVAASPEKKIILGRSPMVAKKIGEHGEERGQLHQTPDRELLA